MPRINRFRLITYILIAIIIFLILPSNRQDLNPTIVVDFGHYKYTTENKYNTTNNDVNLKRSKRVVEAFRHSWQGYEDFAFGYDELHPLSKKGSNWFGLGLTIIDCLDTALIMNQTDIYEKARNWVDKSMSNYRVNRFGTRRRE